MVCRVTSKVDDHEVVRPAFPRNCLCTCTCTCSSLSNFTLGLGSGARSLIRRREAQTSTHQPLSAAGPNPCLLLDGYVPTDAML